MSTISSVLVLMIIMVSNMFSLTLSMLLKKELVSYMSKSNIVTPCFARNGLRLNWFYPLGCAKKQKYFRINPISGIWLCLYLRRHNKKFQEFRGFCCWVPSILRFGQFYKGICPKMGHFFRFGYNFSHETSFSKPFSLVIYILTIPLLNTQRTHILGILEPRLLWPLLTL